MATPHNERCLVLGHAKLGEADAIVTMLSSSGRQVRAVAKGLRRPGCRFGARLEPYALVDVMLHPGRSLDTVTDVRTVDSNAGCRTGVARPAASAVACELADKLTRDGAVVRERTFELAVASLSAIGAAGDGDATAALLASAYCVKAMSIEGFRPSTRECALCGSVLSAPDRAAAFSVAAGGCLCADCAEADGVLAYDIDGALARGGTDGCDGTYGSGPALPEGIAGWVDSLVSLRLADIAALEGAPTAALLDFTASWASEHLGVRLRSIDFLRTLL